MKNQIIFVIITLVTVFFQSTNSYSQSTLCNSEPTGFKYEEYHEGGKQFPQSEYLADITPLRRLHHAHNKGDNVKVKIIDINSSEYKGWQDCGFNNSDYQYFFIMPGDYRAWGDLRIKASGSSNDRRIISAYSPNSNYPYKAHLPVREALNPNKHVIIERLNMEQADYWIVNGLTFSGRAETGKNGKVGGACSRIVNKADHNIINRCLFEKAVVGSNLHIHFSNHNTIQNSIVRNQLGNDFVGILLEGENSVALGNRIVNNEIYDCNDGVQLNFVTGWDDGDLSGTVIENNDIYLTRKAYSKREGYACAENAIDIKIGGKTNKRNDVVKILKNRIWGFRKSDTTCGPSSSHGTGVILHISAENILIKDNVFFDLPEGVGLSHANNRDTNVALINNVFYRMKKYNAESTGRAIRCGVRADIYYNTVGKSDVAVHMGPKTEGGRLQCNTFIGAKEVQPWAEGMAASELNAWYDSSVEVDAIFSHAPENNIVDNNLDKNGLGDFTFYIQRWTGAEKVTFSGLFPQNTSQITLVDSPQINCGPGGEGDRWWVQFMDYNNRIK